MRSPRRSQMAGLPIVKMALPKDLKGVPNGNIPASLLKPIEPSGRLHWRAAQSYAYLRHMAALEGITLGHVGDYRPLAQQIALFESRMRPFPDAKRLEQVTRKWNGVTYYLHVGAPVATPATSNHGLGLAVDFCVIQPNGKRESITTRPKGARKTGLAFLLENAADAGMSWELQVEPWHLRLVTGDKPLPKVLAFNSAG